MIFLFVQEKGRFADVQGVPEVPRGPEARLPKAQGEARGSGPRSSGRPAL